MLDIRTHLIRSLRRAPGIRGIWDQFEVLQRQLDSAIADRYAALAERDAALAESKAAAARETGSLARCGTQLLEIEVLVRDIRSLVGPFGASLPDGKMLVQTLQGIQLIIDPLDVVMSPHLIVYRQWEPDITALLLNSVDSTTVFVDVGANVGYFTCLVATKIRAGSAGRVIAIEPNPECLALLERNLAINWSMCEVDVHRKAASNIEGTSLLSVPHNHAANATLASMTTAAGVSSYYVQTAPLDSMVPKSYTVDILKIDVEGYESAVLEGADDIIKRSPDIKIIMEWSVGQMASANATPASMIDLFGRLDLIPRVLPSSASLRDISDRDAPPYSVEELTSLAYANILLTRRSARF